MSIIYLKVSLGDFDDQLGLGVLALQEHFINLSEWALWNLERLGEMTWRIKRNMMKIHKITNVMNRMSMDVLTKSWNTKMR